MKVPGMFWKKSKTMYVVDIDWMFNKGGGKNLRQRFRQGMKFLFKGKGPKTTIYDARAKEQEEGLSKLEFFDKYGFVLLEHKSSMTADDWLQSDRDINKWLYAYNSKDTNTNNNKKNENDSDTESYEMIMDDFRNVNTPVHRVYAEEVKELLKSTIVPDAKKIMPPARGIRWYITHNPNKGPAKQVHNDYGLNFDEIVDRNPFFDFDKQRAQYEQMSPNAKEYMLINLWRPIKPMNATKETPLRSYPLCFLDSSTLSSNDFVYIDYNSLGLITALKENVNHSIQFVDPMKKKEKQL